MIIVPISSTPHIHCTISRAEHLIEEAESLADHAKFALDNHANQLNPNNEAYKQSLGIREKCDPDGCRTAKSGRIGTMECKEACL